MESIHSGTDGNGKRATIRVTTRVMIQLRLPRHHKTEVRLLDISPVGCRVELPDPVALKDLVTVTLPGLEPIEAVVAWERDWKAGLQFVRPIYLSVFDHLVDRLRQMGS